MSEQQNNEYDPDKHKREARDLANLKKSNMAAVFGSGRGRIAIIGVVVIFGFMLAYGFYNLLFGAPKRAPQSAMPNDAMLSATGARGDGMAATPAEADQRRAQNAAEAAAAQASGQPYMAPPVLVASAPSAAYGGNDLAPASQPAQAQASGAAPASAAQPQAAQGTQNQQVQQTDNSPLRVPVSYRSVAMAIGASDVDPQILGVTNPNASAAQQRRTSAYQTGYYPVQALNGTDSERGGIQSAALNAGMPGQSAGAAAQASASPAGTTVQKRPVPGFTGGTGFYCKITFGINSDLARKDAFGRCYGGAANGAVFIGKAEPSPEGVSDPGFVVTFDKLNLPGHAQLDVNAVAIDNGTMEEAVADSVNDHSVVKFSELAFAGLLKGIGQAAAMMQGSATTQTIGNVSTTTIGTQRPDATQIIGQALGGVGNGIGDYFQRKSDALKTTIKVYPNKDVGIVLLRDVYE